MTPAPILAARVALFSLLWAAASPGHPVAAQYLNEGRSGNMGGPLDDHLAWLAFHDSGWRAMTKG